MQGGDLLFSLCVMCFLDYQRMVQEYEVLLSRQALLLHPMHYIIVHTLQRLVYTCIGTVQLHCSLCLCVCLAHSVVLAGH